ncbi:glycosyltransferase, partial [candidate division KSB1 bacterium]|nr:glycosyltransferase [candidate division KSB1 bacterium]
MKRVLIISYYFPPMGMGGVQRMTKFARYLSDFGWEPTVLTVKPVAYYAHDPSLLDEVKGVRIERTESLDPLRLLQLLHKKGDVKTSQTPKGGGWLSRINNWFTRWFLIPDSKVLWRPFAKRAIQKLHKKTSFDLVMTSSPPHSAHALGAWMQSQYDIPWVADFRDDWMGEEYERGPTYLHNTINHSMARRIVRQTDAVISVSPPISQHLEFLRGSDVLTLYNGFDANDFKSKANSSPD